MAGTDVLVKVGADISDFSRKMNESAKTLGTFSNKTQQTFDDFKSAGKAVTGAGVALAGGLGFAVKKAADFEGGMSKVSAVSGATGKDFQRLSDYAREMGSKTSFSATEAAEGLEYMALAGWDTEQMLGGLEPILHLAEAGALDLGRASDLVTDSMSALGLEVKDLDGYLDKVAETSRSSNTDIDALMEAMVIAGGTFSRFNVPLDEANAFLGVLANRGTKGSEAGTALNAIMNRLTSGTGQAATALDELGISAFDSEGNFKGMEAVMREVDGALKGMTEEEKAHYQSMIAGLEHGKSFEKMLQGLNGEYDDLKVSINESDGALKEMRDTMKDNLKGGIENLASAFEEVAISIGSALLPLVKELTEWLQKIADWFNGLSDGTKQFIAMGAAITAVFALIAGPLMLLIGFIPNIISGLLTVVRVVKGIGTAIAFLTSPISLVVIAVIAAAILVIKYWEPIKEFFIALWDAIKESGIAIWEVLKDIWQVTVEFFVNLWQGIKEFFINLWESIKETAINIWDGITETWDKVVETFFNLWEGVTEFFTELWRGISNFLSETWDNIKSFMSEKIGQILIEVIQKFNEIKSNINEKITEAKNAVVEKLSEMVSNFLSKGAEMLSDIRNKFEDIKSAIRQKITESKEVVLEKLSGMVSDFIAKGAEIVSNVINKFNEVKSNIQNKMQEAKNVAMEKLVGMVSDFKNKVSEIVSAAEDKFNEVKNAIKDKMTEAVKAVAEKVGEMPGKVTEKAGEMLSAGKDLIGGLISGIKEMGAKAVEAITGVVGGIVDKAKSLLKIKSPSRVFKEIGAFTGEGLAMGITGMKSEVVKASEELADASIFNPRSTKPEIDLSYATPQGVHGRLTSAVNGTVDVNNRDSQLVGAINSLERRLGDLEVVMDGEAVGRIVRPHVNAGNAVESTVRRYFD